MQSHSEMLSNVVKRYGIVALCKSVEKGDVAVSEHELTKLIGEAAERSGSSFAKLFEANTEEGTTLRKAIQVARDTAWVKAGTQQLMPTKPTYSDETAEAVNDGGDAYNQLVAMAEKMHAASPERTVAQHFAAIYQDPKFADKAARERAQARSRLPITGGFVR
jgi:hypothetical protein